MVTIGGCLFGSYLTWEHFSVTSFLNFFLRLLGELSGYFLNQMEDEVGTDPNGSEMHLGCHCVDSCTVLRYWKVNQHYTYAAEPNRKIK